MPPTTRPAEPLEQAITENQRKYILAAAVGLCAVVCFFVLSGWMDVKPGSVMVARNNVLFNSDTNLWVNRIIDNARSSQQLVHPLELYLWRGPCRALYHLLEIGVPPEKARLLATRFFAAIFAGIGVAFLAFLALRNGIRGTQFVLLFILYLLFTSSATICLPEHFAISCGLLTIAFVIPFVVANSKTRTAILAALVVLCGGTTITNTAFPAASLVHFSIKSMRAKIIAVLVVLPVAAGMFLFVVFRSDSIHWFVTNYLNLHGLIEPVRVFSYGFYAFVAPAVGPVPHVVRVPGWDMVTYEPGLEGVHISYYFGIQAFGAAAWIALLSMCIYKGFQNERTRPYMWLPLGWVMFNALFHNIWGGEIILYAPHWSWALMGMVILGARDLSRTLIGTIFVPIVISQICTLIAIKNALATIVR